MSDEDVFLGLIRDFGEGHYVSQVARLALMRVKDAAKSAERAAAIEAAIRKHRDQRGDDRCWLDDEELYKTLPEGYTAPARDTAVEMRLCEKFIECRHNPATTYVSPQRRIEELEAELKHIAGWAQATLTALNIGGVDSGSPLHLKLREVMIAHREKFPRT